MTCRSIRASFDDYAHTLLSQQDTVRLEAHIESCSNCKQAWQEYQNVLNIMAQRTRVEPDDHFWSGYWDNLVDRMDREETHATTSHPWWESITEGFAMLPRWTYQVGTAAAMLILGIVIGLQFQQKNVSIPTPMDNGLTMQASTVAVEAQADRYLQRSKMLLLGIVNLEPEKDQFSTKSVQQQRLLSQSLVEEAQIIKTGLQSAEQRRLRELVTELEMLLMQIANLESDYDLSAVEVIQHSVEDRGIFLKIDLEEMRPVEGKTGGESPENKNEKI